MVWLRFRIRIVPVCVAHGGGGGQKRFALGKGFRERVEQKAMDQFGTHRLHALQIDRDAAIADWKRLPALDGDKFAGLQLPVDEGVEKPAGPCAPGADHKATGTTIDAIDARMTRAALALGLLAFGLLPLNLMVARIRAFLKTSDEDSESLNESACKVKPRLPLTENSKETLNLWFYKVIVPTDLTRI